MNTLNVSDDVRQQAELWFARRLEPSVREEESEAFERWCAQDPQHAQAYAETERVWERLAVLKGSSRMRQWVPDTVTLSSPSTSGRRRVVYGLAATVAVIAIGVTYFIGDEGSPAKTFITALGEQRTETLEDGTTLRLNTSSTLDVRMTSSRRDVTLENGEAAFDVARDVARPFVVTAGDGTITAVGTHFQVRHEAHRVTVTLMEGRVQLVRASHREFEWLDPGQQATFSEAESGIVRRNVDVKAVTSWTSGRLELRDTQLEQAVAEANRYSPRKLRIADPAIRSIAVSGTFRTGDIDGIAAALEAAFPVRAEIGQEEIVLYGKK
jgi:transmembrane sensor